MILIEAKERGCDEMGCGHFGASRGTRKHNGIDYCASPGDNICTNVAGSITKLGYTYSDDLSYRYVEVTDSEKQRHRFFYVNPEVSLGDLVSRGDVIGTAQDIAIRYAHKGNMKNHVHYEMKDESGKFIEP